MIDRHAMPLLGLSPLHPRHYAPASVQVDTPQVNVLQAKTQILSAPGKPQILDVPYRLSFCQNFETYSKSTVSMGQDARSTNEEVTEFMENSYLSEVSFSNPTFFATLLVILSVLTPRGSVEAEGFDTRHFDSEVSFKVLAVLPNGWVQDIGSTPTDSRRGLVIPKCKIWYVIPAYSDDRSLQVVIREMNRKSIPGLVLEDPSQVARGMTAEQADEFRKRTGTHTDQPGISDEGMDPLTTF